VAAHWEHFRHEADIGVRGYGATLAQAFEQAATALTAVVTDPAAVKSVQAVQIACDGADPEFLFVEWLNTLIYEMAVRKMLFSRFEVRVDTDRLAATAWGEPVEISRHHPAVEIKGATLTELRVIREPGGQWMAQCVVDV
jgi:SHS2 domain-containing protein